jgi:hypothetical protein
MGLEPALRASSAMLLIYVLAGEECFIFKLAYEFVKLDCIFPAGVGSRHQEGVCHHSSMDSAAGQMAVCIPMVMLGYFQPNPHSIYTRSLIAKNGIMRLETSFA